MKKIFAFFIVFLLSSCTNINFQDKNHIFFYGKNLKIGDILIKEKKLSFTSIFGHVGIIIDENTVGDLPKLGENYYEVNLYTWLEEERLTTILRYKNITPEFQKELVNFIRQHRNVKYSLSFNKFQDEKMYCSQFIWYAYYQTAKKFGFTLDLDGDKGFFVFPYDFFKSKDLIQIF